MKNYDEVVFQFKKRFYTWQINVDYAHLQTLEVLYTHTQTFPQNIYFFL